MNKIVKLTLILTVIAALSGGLLAMVNQMTKPVIDAQAMAAVNESIKQLYEDETFTPANGPGGAITDVYEGDNGSYVYRVSVNGYGGAVVYLVGINSDNTYQGFVPIDFTTESPGFGSRVGEEEFTGQFQGKSIDDAVDAVSGATITSTAVISGLDEVISDYRGR